MSTIDRASSPVPARSLRRARTRRPASSAAGSRRRRSCARGSGSRGCFAAVGAAGRVVVPILIQQAIDKGVDEKTGDVQFDLIVKMALVGAVAVIVSGFAHRQASVRLGVRSEQALYDLRARLIDHIHRLSLATTTTSGAARSSRASRATSRRWPSSSSGAASPGCSTAR